MNDLISRAEAIELKPEFLNPNVNRETKEQTAIDRAYTRGWNSCNTHWIKEIIEDLPSAQPEQRWIPCSERLPKPYEYCLWTTTDGRVIYHHCDGLFSNYTAWMPLPEPYREDIE